MTDTATPGQRVDAAIARANNAVVELRAALQEAADYVGAAVNAKVDEVQESIDEIQSAVDELQGQS